HLAQEGELLLVVVPGQTLILPGASLQEDRHPLLPGRDAEHAAGAAPGIGHRVDQAPAILAQGVLRHVGKDALPAAAQVADEEGAGPRGRRSRPWWIRRSGLARFVSRPRLGGRWSEQTG